MFLYIPLFITYTYLIIPQIITSGYSNIGQCGRNVAFRATVNMFVQDQPDSMPCTYGKKV